MARCAFSMSARCRVPAALNSHRLVAIRVAASDESQPGELHLHRTCDGSLEPGVAGYHAVSQVFEYCVNEGCVGKQGGEAVRVEVTNCDPGASLSGQGWGGGSFEVIRQPAGVGRTDEGEHRTAAVLFRLEEMVGHAPFAKTIGIRGDAIAGESAYDFQVGSGAESPQAPGVDDYVGVPVGVGQVGINEKCLASVFFGPPQAFDQRIAGGDDPDQRVLALFLAENDGDFRQATDAAAHGLAESDRQLDRNRCRLQCFQHASHQRPDVDAFVEDRHDVHAVNGLRGKRVKVEICHQTGSRKGSASSAPRASTRAWSTATAAVSASALVKTFIA